jgi:hypothetical protein
MKHVLALLSIVTGLFLAFACSSSSSGTTTPACMCTYPTGPEVPCDGKTGCYGNVSYECSTSGVMTKKGVCGLDSGDGEDGGACLPLGGDCSGKNEFDCCLAIDGPSVNCGTRTGASHATCTSSTGGPCKSDTDCLHGTCGSKGVCVVAGLGGACSVDDDCEDRADGGKLVGCGSDGTCEIITFDASTGDAGEDAATGDAGEDAGPGDAAASDGSVG